MIFSEPFTEHCVQVQKEVLNTSVLIDELVQNRGQLLPLLYV